jgi:prevent-host-death family protein
MQSINSREAQNKFGELMNKAIKEPVVINKHGKPCAVLMSFEEYERFSNFEDLYWSKRSDEASKEGFLSNKESDDFLTKILTA